MDQTKIGSFIQSLRKQEKLTQKELAEKLGVSDKLISKWETGNGMPDISILDILCSTLHISVNELLSGEKVPPEKYTEKAEENIMELLKTKKADKKAYILQLCAGIIFLILSILYMALSTYGASPSLVQHYIDIPSLIIVTISIFACVLITGAKNVIAVIRKTALPIGVIVMVFEMIGLFSSVPDFEALLVCMSIALLPMLYAAGIYVAALLVETKQN